MPASPLDDDDDDDDDDDELLGRLDVALRNGVSFVIV
jgi:hypothetical protein